MAFNKHFHLWWLLLWTALLDRHSGPLNNSSVGPWLSLSGEESMFPLLREWETSCLWGTGFPCPRVELTSGWRLSPFLVELGAEAESSEGRETGAQFQRKSIETPGLLRRRAGYLGSGTWSWRTAAVRGGLDMGPWLESPPSAWPAWKKIIYFLTGGQWLHNIVMASAIEHHNSAMGTHMPPHPEPPSQLPLHPAPEVVPSAGSELPSPPADACWLAVFCAVRLPPFSSTRAPSPSPHVHRSVPCVCVLTAALQIGPSGPSL